MQKALLNQEALEAKSGVPQSTISKVLNGQRRELSLMNALRLAIVFNLAVEDLFPATVEEIQTGGGK